MLVRLIRFMEIKNNFITFSVSDINGSIYRLDDNHRKISYIHIDKSNVGIVPPFRLDYGNGMIDPQIDSFHFNISVSRDKATCLWQTLDGIFIQSIISLSEEKISFVCKIINNTDKTIHAIEYPIISGIRRIAGQHRDFLAHSYGTGILIHDPYDHFTYDGNGLRYMPYPECFSGCSAQFFTYYGEGKGGLLFAAYDSDYHLKWLNFYHMNKTLEASHICGNENIHPGSNIEQQYPFIVRLTSGKGWYEAADIYREWALSQPWCTKGPLYQMEKSQKAVWLLEKVGLCTFGINAMHDRTLWLKRYHEDIGTPIFHILGPDWTNTPQTFGYGVPGGMKDWVPTRFCKANLNMIHEQHDYVAPFEFDFLVDLNKDDSNRLEENLMSFPQKALSFDNYQFKILCPVSSFTKEFHVERDVQVLKESDVDAFYYDISANNLIMSCLNEQHGHPIGGSSYINIGFIDIYLNTKLALTKEKKCYVPIGTELINEIFLSSLDYYQARSWGQPSSSLEFWPIRGLFITGVAEPIPLFSYTYSGYLPVRMDGWGKLVKETGSFFYMVVARVYLWGGIYEINHEYSSMEAINGRINDSCNHYFHFDPVYYEYSEERAKYLRQFAALRVGEGNRYLAYGRMLPPPVVSAKSISYNYYHYNHNQEDASYQSFGTVITNPIIVSAWMDPEDNSIAVFLANTDQSTTVELYLNNNTELTGEWKAQLYKDFDPDSPSTTKIIGIINIEKPIKLLLPARAPIMLRLLPKE